MKRNILSLEEKKDHIIRRMPNLTDEEKDKVISYFNTHPNEESKIDWNSWKTLTYDDFKPLLQTVSRTAKKKMVKNYGIEGLTEGEDYVVVFNDQNIVGYAPLDHEASQKIASKYIGNCEGKWCVAYQKSDEYWNKYVADEETNFIYFVDYDPNSSWGKVADRIFRPNKYEIWNAKDDKIFDTRSPVSSYGRYPDFLFDVEFMTKLHKIALQKIEDAGGQRAQKVTSYSVRVSVYGELKDDYHLEGSVYYEQMEMTGDDYDFGNFEGSSFDIYVVGKDVGGSSDLQTEFIYDIEEFYPMNGNGLVIHYTDDDSPDDARRRAEHNLQGDWDSDWDSWDISREVKKLVNGLTIDYIMVRNNSLDDVLIDIIPNHGNLSFSWYGPGDKKRQEMDVMDSLGNTYTIYYNPNYDYMTKPNIGERATWQAQRQRDRQIDLPYEEFNV